MTGRADFSHVEWELLVRGFTRPAELVSLAEPGGIVLETVHMFLAFGEARKRFVSFDLIQELLQPFAEEEIHRRIEEARRFSQEPVSFERYHEMVLNDLRYAMETLRAKATAEEVEAYQQMVLYICQRVAAAYDEQYQGQHDLQGVTPNEQAVIDDVQKVLTGPQNWIEKITEDIRQFFGGGTAKS
ncbi:MAG: hypothetical protein HC837_21235 [Chloroflexaceae bacterium]|nr:hypothetical protein [Chloroflexaceae bacterium]